MFRTQVSMPIDDPPPSHALGQQSGTFADKPPLYRVNAADGSGRNAKTWVEQNATPRLAAGRSVRDTARELIDSNEFRGADWGGWDAPERIVITVATIDRHRRGATGPVGARDRAQIFSDVASLAR